MTGDSLLDVLERAVVLSRAAALDALDADTLLAAAEEATVASFDAGDTIGGDGAAYVLVAPPGRVVPAGERVRADQAVRALRLEADRWLDLVGGS